MDTEYRMHKGARTSLIIAGVLCILLVFSAPIGIWIIIRASGGKVVVTPTELLFKAILSMRINLQDVQRIGILKVPMANNKGLGGALAKAKVGGDTAIHLCVMTKAGKTKNFIVSPPRDSLISIYADCGSPQG